MGNSTENVHFQKNIKLVRIGIGAFDGNQVYRCAKVVGVKEGRVYRLGRTKTDLALVLAYGAQERTFRMEFVSRVCRCC